MPRCRDGPRCGPKGPGRPGPKNKINYKFLVLSDSLYLNFLTLCLVTLGWQYKYLSLRI